MLFTHSYHLFLSIILSAFISLSLPYALATENSEALQNPKMQHRILVMGDSISAAFGINKEQGWVSLLKHKIIKQYPHSQIMNASISGETTSGGANRLKTILHQYQPTLVILELGGNDGLRGTPIKLISQNLAYMIKLSKNAGTKVLLLGMRIPPNYGQTYSELFASQYQKLASDHKIKLVSFLLNGIAGQAGMMQADGIHPTKDAQPLMMQSVWQELLPLL